MKTLRCQKCGHRWETSEDTAQKTEVARKANQQGPFCGLCRHLTMAAAYASLRGMKTFGDIARWWTEGNPNKER